MLTKEGRCKAAFFSYTTIQNKPPVPANEEGRLKALYGYEILDTENEEAFDSLAELASFVCDVPISQIRLIAEERQWFKSSLGLLTAGNIKGEQEKYIEAGMSDFFSKPVVE